jgi:hypothetical protein
MCFVTRTAIHRNDLRALNFHQGRPVLEQNRIVALKYDLSESLFVLGQ